MRSAAAASVIALVLCGVAEASWASDGSGTAASAATTMPAGNVPSGSVAGSAVTLTWAASTFASGGAVPAYVVRRFNSITQVEASVRAADLGHELHRERRADRDLAVHDHAGGRQLARPRERAERDRDRPPLTVENPSRPLTNP